MKLPVMRTAERNSEVVADLAGHRSRLREADMVGVGRCLAAKQAGLGGDEAEVILVSGSMRLREGEGGLLNAAAGCCAICRRHRIPAVVFFNWGSDGYGRITAVCGFRRDRRFAG